MSFDMLDCANSTDVVSSSNIAESSWNVGDIALNIVLFEVVFNGVSFSNFGMRESDSSSVVGDNVLDFVQSNSSPCNLEELEFSFSFFNFDEGESTLDVIENSVVFTGFDHSEDIHDSDWELSISSEFIIDLKSSFFIHGCQDDFSRCVSEFKSISTL